MVVYALVMFSKFRFDSVQNLASLVYKKLADKRSGITLGFDIN